MIGRRFLGLLVVGLLISFGQPVVFSIQRHHHDVVRLGLSFAGEDQQPSIRTEARMLVVVWVARQVDRVLRTIQSHQKDVGIEIEVVLGIGHPFTVG